MEVLQAHHSQGYQHHGYEHEHMDELKAWCVPCHLLEHGKVDEAIIADWDWKVKNELASPWTLFREGFELKGKKRLQTADTE